MSDHREKWRSMGYEVSLILGWNRQQTAVCKVSVIDQRREFFKCIIFADDANLKELLTGNESLKTWLDMNE